MQQQIRRLVLNALYLINSLGCLSSSVSVQFLVSWHLCCMPPAPQLQEGAKLSRNTLQRRDVQQNLGLKVCSTSRQLLLVNCCACETLWLSCPVTAVLKLNEGELLFSCCLAAVLSPAIPLVQPLLPPKVNDSGRELGSSSWPLGCS